MSAKILASLHRQRAMGQMEPIVYRGEVTGEVMRKSDVLAMFYLKESGQNLGTPRRSK
jgi:hypothetical protein